MIFEEKATAFASTLSRIARKYRTEPASLNASYEYNRNAHFVYFNFPSANSTVSLRYNENSSELDSIIARLLIGEEVVCELYIDEENSLFQELTQVFVDAEKAVSGWETAIDIIDNSIDG